MSSSTTDQCWSLLLDFSNAFNCIDREVMFAETRIHIPTLSAWMESCYSCQPFLLLGKESIRSCCGVQQGDPLGPLGFALTLHPLIKKIKAEVPGLSLNAWYLDDGTLMGCPQDLASALHIIERDGPSLGLHLNRRKSLLFFPRMPMDLYHLSLRTSLSLAVASHYWAAPLVLLTSVRRSFKPGCQR